MWNPSIAFTQFPLGHEFAFQSQTSKSVVPSASMPGHTSAASRPAWLTQTVGSFVYQKLLGAAIVGPRRLTMFGLRRIGTGVGATVVATPDLIVAGLDAPGLI